MRHTRIRTKVQRVTNSIKKVGNKGGENEIQITIELRNKAKLQAEWETSYNSGKSGRGVNLNCFVKAIERDTHKEENKSSMGYKSDNEISEARVRKTKFGPQFKLHNKVKCKAQRLLNCNSGR